MNITNNNKNILRLLANGPVIPAPRSIDDFKYALQHHPSPTVILLFGDINVLPSLLQQAKQHNKRILVRFDLLGGIGNDRAAVYKDMQLYINEQTPMVYLHNDESIVGTQKNVKGFVPSPSEMHSFRGIYFEK